MLKQLFLIVFLPLGAFAQITLTGRVINKTDSKPVVLASVFLSNATIGSKTSADGTFSLRNITPGKYELVVSSIGFETFSTKITIGLADASMHDIAISPKSIGLQEVVIKPNIDRSRNYQWFKEQFLGTSELAKQCKILNPEVLDLDYDSETNTLTGSSSEFLEIENPALGYRIKYLLANFAYVNKSTDDIKVSYKGAVLYQEMAGSPSQQRRWQQRRFDVYENSEMHFFRSLIHNRMDEEGFRVQQLSNYANPDRPSDSLINARIKHFQQLKQSGEKHLDSIAYWTKKTKLPKILQKFFRGPLATDEILFEADQPGLYALGCNMDGLLITYNKSRHFPGGDQLTYINAARNTENTLVSFNTPFAFSYGNGVLINPYSVVYYGVWGRNRVAEQLPTDYQPPGYQSTNAAIDSTLAKRTLAKLNDYNSSHITENAYLHFDKPYYAAGDTVYFKAYVTAGDSNKLSAASGVLHADLINTANKIDQSILLHLTNGVTWGDFALPDSLPQGSYRVRAYTKLMRNADNAFFDGSIPIGSVNVKRISESASANRGGTPDIQFFPEGGHMLAGMNSTIAFKAISTDGYGIDVKGEVLDDHDKTVATFASAHLGMGKFNFQPHANVKYKVKTNYRGGVVTTTNLPVAEDNDIQLSVANNSSERAIVTISASTTYFKANINKDLFLIVYSAGVPTPYFCKLDSQIVRTAILKNTLHTGVASVTLFDGGGDPVSERLLFIRHDEGLKLQLTPNDQATAPRAPVNILLNTKAADNSLSGGHFSVSIIDERRVPIEENTEHTIYTDLLLTGNLKGYIEQPNYYFINPTKKTDTDLDLVMLTNGYRSFVWKRILDNTKMGVAYQAETGLEINGVIKKKDTKPLWGGTISLLPMGGGQPRVEDIDSNGRFRFSNMVFKDSSSFVLRAKNEKTASRLSVSYLPEKPAPVTPPLTPVINEDNLDNLLSTYMENRKKQIAEYVAIKGMMLKEVHIRQLRKEKEYRTYSLAGAGNADQVIQRKDFENYGYGKFSDVFNGRLLGVIFVGDDPFPKVPYLPIASRLGQPTRMLIIVDGAQMDATFSPDELNLRDIETIEVLKFGAAGVYGAKGGGGVLVITTRTGYDDQGTASAASGILPIKPKGFYVAREFYSPKYQHVETSINHKDLRSTIYWNPEVITDAEGNAKFTYYNADAGDYRVVIEGIDDSGNLGRTVYRYVVK